MSSWGRGRHDGISALRSRDQRASLLCLPCEDNTVSRQPSASQEESSQEELNWPAPQSWTSSLQSCEKMHFYSLSHPVLLFCYDSLSWLIQGPSWLLLCGNLNPLRVTIIRVSGTLILPVEADTLSAFWGSGHGSCLTPHLLSLGYSKHTLITVAHSGALHTSATMHVFYVHTESG